VRTVTDHDGNRLPMIVNPIRMSGTPVRDAAAPPTLGQHSDEILRDILGYDDAHIASLRAEGAI
jgi:crotonobetainyl-CoA:carnitine CoA-transferase CaiB-like acyl-CoA transferase